MNRPGWKPPGLLLWGPQGGKPHPSICPPFGAAGRLSRSCHSSRTRKAAYTRPFLPSRRVTDRRDSRPHIGSFFARGTEAGEGGPPQPSLESPTGERVPCVFSSAFWPAAVSAIFKWLQLGTRAPCSAGELPGTQDLDLNFGKPPLLTVVKILCPIGAKPSPRRASGHPQAALSIGGPGARGLY